MKAKSKRAPLEFPKELFIYDEEYFQRVNEMDDDPDLDEPETDQCLISGEEIPSVAEGTPVAKYVLVGIGEARTIVIFKKV